MVPAWRDWPQASNRARRPWSWSTAWRTTASAERTRSCWPWTEFAEPRGVLEIAKPWAAAAPELALTESIPLNAAVAVTGHGVIDDPQRPERRLRYQTAAGGWRETTMWEGPDGFFGRFASTDVLRGMCGGTGGARRGWGDDRDNLAAVQLRRRLDA